MINVEYSGGNVVGNDAVNSIVSSADEDHDHTPYRYQAKQPMQQPPPPWCICRKEQEVLATITNNLDEIYILRTCLGDIFWYHSNMKLFLIFYFPFCQFTTNTKLMVLFSISLNQDAAAGIIFVCGNSEKKRL